MQPLKNLAVCQSERNQTDLAIESMQRALNISKKLLQEKKSKDMENLKASINEIMITYYTFYDKARRYDDAEKILEEYIDLSK